MLVDIMCVCGGRGLCDYCDRQGLSSLTFCPSCGCTRVPAKLAVRIQDEYDGVTSAEIDADEIFACCPHCETASKVILANCQSISAGYPPRTDAERKARHGEQQKLMEAEAEAEAQNAEDDYDEEDDDSDYNSMQDWLDHQPGGLMDDQS